MPDTIQSEMNNCAIVVKVLIVAIAGIALFTNSRETLAPVCGTAVWDLLLAQAIIQTIQFSILMFFPSFATNVGIYMIHMIAAISFLVAGLAIYIPAELNSDCVQLLSTNDFKSLANWPYLIIAGLTYTAINGIFVLLSVGDAFFYQNNKHQFSI